MLPRTRLLAPVFLATLLVAAGASATAGFDLSPEQSGRVRADKDAALVKSIPKDFHFVDEAVFTVAVAPSGVPPIASYATDAATVIGADPDIAQLVADKLGRPLKLVAVAWEDWPLGLVSGKFDAVISNVGVTEERKLKYDFSSYRQGLHGFYVRKDSPIQKIAEPKDVAGLKIVTDPGTIQEKIIVEWDRRNSKAGLKPVEIILFDDEAASNLALRSGRADAVFSVNAVQSYQAAVTGDARLVGTVNAGWPLTTDVGVVTRRGSGIADVVTAALNETIKDGKYKQVLDKWNLGPEAIDRSRTNPPGLPKY